MRSIIAILAVIAGLSSECYGQDCKTLVLTTQDKMTGDITSRAPISPIAFTKTGTDSKLSAFWLFSDSSISLIFLTRGAGCVEHQPTINFLFRDGTRMQRIGGNAFNCDGRAAIYYDSDSDYDRRDLDSIASKEIEAIRVWTSKSYSQEDLSKAQSKLFMNSLKCLMVKLPPRKVVTEEEILSDAIIIETPAPVIEEPKEDNQIFTVVEQQPEYTGGYIAMMEFIKKNMRYPASARKMGIDGTVYVQFVVGKDGTISDIKTIRGLSADCDKEAERVVGSMPPWMPGKENEKPAFVRFVLPIRFSLR